MNMMFMDAAVAYTLEALMEPDKFGPLYPIDTDLLPGSSAAGRPEVIEKARAWVR